MKILSKLRVILLLSTLVFSACKKDPKPDLPEAKFQINGGFRPAPVTIELENLTTNADSYMWDFGDGSTSTEKNPSHTYTEPGNYTIRLVATNEDGDNQTSQNVYVYGDILSWTPSRITVLKDKWEQHENYIVYAVLRHSNGNIFDYTQDQSGTYLPEAISFTSDGRYVITNFQRSMDLSTTNGSAKIEVRGFTGGTTVNPNSDPLLFSHTIHVSDIIPSNEQDPYIREVLIEDKGVIIQVKYNEAD
jgi:PKD repeat protein